MITFTVRWPEDASRVVPLPASNLAHFVAAQPFTLRIGAESWQSLSVDGEAKLELKLAEVTEVTDAEAHWHFADGSTGRTSLVLLPDAGRLEATSLTHGPWSGTHGILSNLRGNAVQARASWGRVESKYDALLAVNFAEEGPGDRRVVMPWLSAVVVLGAQRIELNADAVETFEAREHSLHWVFAVQGLRLEAALWLGDGKAIRVRFTALSPAGKDVQVHLRPALDDRSFHQVTKAFQGAEKRFPESLHAEEKGFRFDLEGGYALLVHGTEEFHAEPAWQYCVPLPEEQQRGLEDTMDVFFPGHFVWHPAANERFDLTAAVDDDDPPVTEGVRRDISRPLPLAMRQSLELYLSARGDALTVIAGYPWFLDWGRDSLIFVRALIADERLQEAGDVLRRFGMFEEKGTLPNLLRGAEVSNRETSDAPLWWVVAAGEWLAANADDVLDLDGRTLRDVILSIVTGYRDGTAGGVKMDPASGLIFSPAHYTWMDTNDPCGTPREGYPIEIQALWIAALRVVQLLAPDSGWTDISDHAKRSLESLYWRASDGWFSDCLHASSGTPASEAVADDHLRPNQWIAFALHVLPDMDKVRSALAATQCLLVPGAARSLAPRPVQHAMPVIRDDGALLNDPHAPYWPRYNGPENLSRKPAYHNGTAWCWQFPLYVESLIYAFGDGCHDLARRLMSASVVPWQHGCAGQLPEILDGDLPHLQRGCGAQAWSVSEWVRVWALLGR
jgi:glycogen debranching enzyme